MSFIPYGKQNINQNDIDAVVAVLKSDYLTQGPVIEQFEGAVTAHCGVKHGVVTNSATSSLHLACLALGLGEGDALWTSPNTFVASANVGLYCGATVDFVDIDPQTYNMCADALEAKLIKAKQLNNLPKIVIPVHFAGQSCDMDAIHKLSIEYGFSIIEDASNAIGGKYLSRPIGNCQFSKITVFSFHPVKIITTGEGGIATTNDPALADKMKMLRSHGVTRNESEMDPTLSNLNTNQGDWYYQQMALGFNYRMTEMQGALGLSQMKQLDRFVAQRSKLADQYNQLLSGIEQVTLPFQSNRAESSFHLFPIQVPSKKRANVFRFLRENGIGANVHYIPVHMQPFYQKLGFKFGDFPIAEGYYQQAISLPLHPSLTDEDQMYIVAKLKESLT